MTPIERLREIVSRLSSRTGWAAQLDLERDLKREREGLQQCLRAWREANRDAESQWHVDFARENVKTLETLIGERTDEVIEAHRLIVELRPDLLGSLPSPDGWRDVIYHADAWERIRQRLLVAPPETSKPAGPASEPPTIVIQSDGNVRIGDGDAVRLTQQEDDVLRSFCAAEAMTLDELKRASNVDGANKVLAALSTKYGGRFAPAITLPGGKGRGGYRVRIRPENDRKNTASIAPRPAG